MEKKIIALQSTFKTAAAFDKLFGTKHLPYKAYASVNESLSIISLNSEVEDNGWTNTLINTNPNMPGAYVIWHNHDFNKVESEKRTYAAQKNHIYLFIMKLAKGQPYTFIGAYQYDDNTGSGNAKQEIRWKRVAHEVEIDNINGEVQVTLVNKKLRPAA